MGYDIHLQVPYTEEVATVSFTHNITGSTYALGGTNRLEICITFNYADILAKALGNDKGIESLNFVIARDSIPLLEKAINSLGDDANEDYWEPTEGNVKIALRNLLYFARLEPLCIWRVSL